MPAPQVELDELYRMSTDTYHRLIEAGAAEDFPNCELIDGVLVHKDVKTREHENAIASLLEWLIFGIDRAIYQLRVGSSLTLVASGSEPEPDLAVIARDAHRPYHSDTAALAVEVSWSSLRRDLNRKAALYAEAGVAEYWVFDVKGRRVVVHRKPGDESYGEVREGPRGPRGRADRRRAGRPAGPRRRRALAATYS
jgi:Uma2 family endonuclease